MVTRKESDNEEGLEGMYAVEEGDGRIGRMTRKAAGRGAYSIRVGRQEVATNDNEKIRSKTKRSTDKTQSARRSDEHRRASDAGPRGAKARQIWQRRDRASSQPSAGQSVTLLSRTPVALELRSVEKERERESDTVSFLFRFCFSLCFACLVQR